MINFLLIWFIGYFAICWFLSCGFQYLEEDGRKVGRTDKIYIYATTFIAWPLTVFHIIYLILTKDE